MALRRLTDLTDTEKYTVHLGHDTPKVAAVLPTLSNCTVQFQAGLGGLLGSASKLEFYWEDVKAIHCDTIQTYAGANPARVFYQCTLLVADGKKPLTVQCATAVNLDRFVSAVEYWLKASGKSEAPVTGIPYINQGVKLDMTGKVTTLLAESPADKAGTKITDMVWSLEQDTHQAQRPADLEAALQSLTPGSHALYLVNQADWTKAQNMINFSHNYSFTPTRRKVSLIVP
jgi:hypothetical protein